MASSDFWRDLAAEFQKLPDFWTVSAEWKNYGGGTPESWSLSGSNAAKYSFEALASRAGREIAKEGASHLLTVWLDKLKQEGIGFKQMAFVLIPNSDGSEREECQAGQIPHVCEASLYLCKKFETRALQLEFEERQRNAESIPQSNGTLSKAVSAKPQSLSSPKGDRRILVDQFIARVMDSTTRKINRADIWTAAGYLDATEFQRFQRHDKRTTRSAVANFSRVLNMEPEAFLKILDRKQEAK
jgi:hypothetical protein